MEVVDYQKEYGIGVCGHRWVSSQLEESNDPHQVEQWFAFHIPYSSSCSSPVIKVRPSLPDPFLSVKLFGVRNTHAYGGSSTVSYMCLMVSLLSFLKIVAGWRFMTPSQIHGSPCPVLLFLFLLFLFACMQLLNLSNRLL